MQETAKIMEHNRTIIFEANVVCNLRFFCVKYRNEPVALGLAQPVAELSTRNIS
jgi:hypothetical protein